MANNYTLGSSRLEIPADKMDKAREIVERIKDELEEQDECCDAGIHFESDGIWFSHGERGDPINPEHVCIIAEQLQQELELDGPFHAEFAFECSKPRIDEFGGCGFVCERGQPTVWASSSLINDPWYVAWAKSRNTNNEEA